ncbi:MAG: hypothetical protein M1826_000022 [Phylliscum demangeonii]|nr:MAG: hypothetical protein M1826_000022 [Phylliscum demangeonii]
MAWGTVLLSVGRAFALGYADVHYYFSPPAQRPPHHRFDKGSYVYLYHSSAGGRGRLEIANSAGTPYQDAVSGPLDVSHIQHSHKHPTLCTVTVNGSPDPGHQHHVPEHAWHLPAPDPRGEGRYMYRLHTLDIYLWTEQDAVHFMNSAKRVLSPSQITSLDIQALPTTTSHGEVMSPVVQKLEHMAITGTGDRRPGVSLDARPVSTASGHAISPRPTSGAGSMSTLNSAHHPPPNYTPLAYNPAAPAAPEPITHREKTPPPVDVAAGESGLSHVVQYDAGGTYSSQHLPAPGASPALPPHSQSYTHGPRPPSFSGPPQQSQASSAAPPTFAGPPSSLALPTSAYANPPRPGSVSSLPGLQQQQQHPAHQSLGPPTTGSYHPQTQYGHSPPPPAGAGYFPATGPPGMQSYQAQSPPPLQPLQAPAVPSASSHPVGYQYGQPPQHSNPYALPNQAWTPTEAETNAHSHQTAGPGPTSRLDAGTMKLEKGVSNFLKKLEKRIG